MLNSRCAAGAGSAEKPFSRDQTSQSMSLENRGEKRNNSGLDQARDMLKPLACSSLLAEGVQSNRPEDRTSEEAPGSDLCSENKDLSHSSGQKHATGTLKAPA